MDFPKPVAATNPTYQTSFKPNYQVLLFYSLFGAPIHQTHLEPSPPDEFKTKNQALKLLNFEPKTTCLFCDGQNTAKAGQRTKREGTAQKYYCKTCKKYFSSLPMPHKTYSPKVILNGINYYNLGYKLDATRKKLNNQFKQQVPKGTLTLGYLCPLPERLFSL